MYRDFTTSKYCFIFVSIYPSNSEYFQESQESGTTISWVTFKVYFPKFSTMSSTIQPFVPSQKNILLLCEGRHTSTHVLGRGIHGKRFYFSLLLSLFLLLTIEGGGFDLVWGGQKILGTAQKLIPGWEGEMLKKAEVEENSRTRQMQAGRNHTQKTWR